MRALPTLLIVALYLSSAAAEPAVSVGDNIAVKGVPDVPQDLASKVDRYGQYRTARFAAWHPDRLEMLVLTRFANTTQVHQVSNAGARREQWTFFPEPVLDVSAWHKKGDQEFFTFLMDAGGDEFYQIYSYDPLARQTSLLTDGRKRNGGGVYSDASRLLAYSRVDADSKGALTEIRTVDPLDPTTDRLVKKVRGGGWRPSDWSSDGERLLVSEYRSINDSRIWQVDVKSGNAKRISPTGDPGNKSSEWVAHGYGKYARKNNGIYFASDEDSEFRQLVHIEADTRRTITQSVWDVESVDVSPDGKLVAYVTNDAGRSSLHIIDSTTGDAIPMPPIPAGVISSTGWHNNGRHFAFSLSSASVPGDVFVFEVDGGLERWTYSESDVDTSGFPEPELVKWKSFDDRKITGFLYRPPARFTGKRPVIINIHGGPESQSRPRYLGRMNYFLNELGMAIVFPNVRGSRGYGKSYLKLDNGLLREGTHRDISALIDWIESRDNLDADRILVRGGSYGGYMTLSAAYRFSDRITCAIDIVGISNLRTFLENTQGYRRELRRAEYGDERTAKLRKWMDETSALQNANKIRKPMLVLQGANDPRVPKSESDQIVAALEKTGTPIWYVVFEDEGHGFRKKTNADYAFYCTVLFAQKFLQ